MKQKNNRSSSIEPTLQLPQAPEMEVAVLGALLLEPAAIERVAYLLKPDDFYSAAHQLVYQAILQLYEKQHPVDLLTVMKELQKMKAVETVGGPYALSMLTAKVCGSGHLEHHAAVVADRSLARKLIFCADRISKEAYDEMADVPELVGKFEQELTGLTIGSHSASSLPLCEALQKARLWAGELQALKERGASVAIPTGIPRLDDALDGGWHTTDLIVVGGRPSMGKTQHALQFAKSAAQAGVNVLSVLGEMGEVPVANRLILEDSTIDSRHLRTGELTEKEWEAMEKRVGALWHLPLRLAGSHQMRNLACIFSEARRLRRKNMLDMLMIDHVGLVRTNLFFSSRYLEIGYITRELKCLAQELNIPVVLLSQLGRPPKGMEVRPPKLDELRESGDIEQDADVVILLHKPDYYQPDAMDSAGVPWKNRGKYIIAKNREGARNSSVIFYHDDRYKRISDSPLD